MAHLHMRFNVILVHVPIHHHMRSDCLPHYGILLTGPAADDAQAPAKVQPPTAMEPQPEPRRASAPLTARATAAGVKAPAAKPAPVGRTAVRAGAAASRAAGGSAGAADAAKAAQASPSRIVKQQRAAAPPSPTRPSLPAEPAAATARSTGLAPKQEPAAGAVQAAQQPSRPAGRANGTVAAGKALAGPRRGTGGGAPVAAPRNSTAAQPGTKAAAGGQAADERSLSRGRGGARAGAAGVGQQRQGPPARVVAGKRPAVPAATAAMGKAAKAPKRGSDISASRASLQLEQGMSVLGLEEADQVDQDPTGGGQEPANAKVGTLNMIKPYGWG